jgi:2'-5' RNA ligase
MKRIFVAINLSEDIKNKLQEYQREWADLPVRFTKKNSLHLTLLFIGYVDDERMLDACQKIHEIAKKHKPFEINFNKICLAPPARNASRSDAGGPNRPPRLIWLEGERNEQLADLKRDIEKTIGAQNGDECAFTEIERELKIFLPHITLARIRQMEWRKLTPKPEIDKSVSINVSVNSIEVMESDLKRSGAEYAILESAVLSQ